MSGFEPGSSDNGNNRSANCATTTALVTMSLVISFMLYSNALNLSSLTSFLKLLKRLPHSSHHILNKLTIDFSSPFVYALTSFGYFSLSTILLKGKIFNIIQKEINFGFLNHFSLIFPSYLCSLTLHLPIYVSPLCAILHKSCLSISLSFSLSFTVHTSLVCIFSKTNPVSFILFLSLSLYFLSLSFYLSLFSFIQFVSLYFFHSISLFHSICLSLSFILLVWLLLSFNVIERKVNGQFQLVQSICSKKTDMTNFRSKGCLVGKVYFETITMAYINIVRKV